MTGISDNTAEKRGAATRDIASEFYQARAWCSLGNSGGSAVRVAGSTSSYFSSAVGWYRSRFR